jgi:hypothetical protein
MIIPIDLAQGITPNQSLEATGYRPHLNSTVRRLGTRTLGRSYQVLRCCPFDLGVTTILDQLTYSEKPFFDMR